MKTQGDSEHGGIMGMHGAHQQRRAPTLSITLSIKIRIRAALSILKKTGRFRKIQSMGGSWATAT